MDKKKQLIGQKIDLDKMTPPQRLYELVKAAKVVIK